MLRSAKWFMSRRDISPFWPSAVAPPVTAEWVRLDPPGVGPHGDPRHPPAGVVPNSGPKVRVSSIVLIQVNAFGLSGASGGFDLVGQLMIKLPPGALHGSVLPVVRPFGRAS